MLLYKQPQQFTWQSSNYRNFQIAPGSLTDWFTMNLPKMKTTNGISKIKQSTCQPREQFMYTTK